MTTNASNGGTVGGHVRSLKLTDFLQLVGGPWFKAGFLTKMLEISTKQYTKDNS